MAALFKIATMLSIFIAASAVNFIYDTSFIEDINDVVLTRKSNTCVILVVDGQIKFVSTEGDSAAELAECGQSVSNRNLEIIKARFEPLSTQDVIEKLSIIGSKYSTFLVYFCTGPPMPSIPLMPRPVPVPVPILVHDQMLAPTQNGFLQQAFLQRALNQQMVDEGLRKIILAMNRFHPHIESIQTINFRIQ